MKSPLISIIIPAYNKGERISKTIDSLKYQTYSNFEAIIINDGSTDNTIEVAVESIMDDSRFKIINQENQGVADARNNGIKIAQGTYVTFLDADDFYLEKYLEIMLSQITKEKSEVCYCGYFKQINNGKLIAKYTKFNEGDILVKYITGKISINTNSWLIKKELIKKNNLKFPSKNNWGEDFVFFCSLLATTNRVVAVKEHLSVYCIDTNKSHLSNFDLSLIDKDFSTFNYMTNQLFVKKNKLLVKSFSYRFSSQLTNHLLKASRVGISNQQIKYYLNRYKKYFFNINFTGGIRVIRLFFYKIKIFLYFIKR